MMKKKLLLTSLFGCSLVLGGLVSSEANARDGVDLDLIDQESVNDTNITLTSLENNEDNNEMDAHTLIHKYSLSDFNKDVLNDYILVGSAHVKRPEWVDFKTESSEPLTPATYDIYEKEVRLENGDFSKEQVLVIRDGVLYGSKDEKSFDNKTLDKDSVREIVIEDSVTLYEDASYLFANYPRLEHIYGFSDLDFSKVTSLDFAFFNDKSLSYIDFGSVYSIKDSGKDREVSEDDVDSSSLVSVNGLFKGAVSLKGFDISSLPIASIDENHKKDVYQLTSNLEAMVVSEQTGVLSFIDFTDAFNDVLWDLNHTEVDTLMIKNYQPIALTYVNKIAGVLSDENISDSDHLEDSLDTVDNDTSLDINDEKDDDLGETSPYAGQIITGKYGDAPFTYDGSTQIMKIHPGVIRGNNKDSVDPDGSPVLKNNIRKIIIENGVIADENAEHLFSGFNPEGGLVIEGLGNLDVTNVKVMDSMFASSTFKALDVTPLQSAKSVSSMKGMFSVSTIFDFKGLDKLKTSNVEDFSSMFFGSKINVINLSNFDFQNALSTSEMFSSSASTLNNGFFTPDTLILPSKFNTKQVTDMSGMFSSIKLSDNFIINMDTSSLENAYQMFFGISQPAPKNDLGLKLLNLTLQGFANPKLEDFSQMFAGLSANSLSMPGFRTPAAKTMSRMFSNFNVNSFITFAENPLYYFDTSKVEFMDDMFNGFRNSFSAYFDVSQFNTRNVKSMSQMFANTDFQKLNVSTFDTRNVKNMSGMFANNTNLSQLILFSNVNNVTDFSSMFANTTSLPYIDVGRWNTRSGKNYENMFLNATSINELNLRGFDLGYTNNGRASGYNVNNMLKNVDLMAIDINSSTGPLSELGFRPRLESKWVSNKDQILSYEDFLYYAVPSRSNIAATVEQWRALFDGATNVFNPEIVIPNKPGSGLTTNFDKSDGYGGFGWDNFYINFATNITFPTNNLVRNINKNQTLYNNPVSVKKGEQLAPFIQFTIGDIKNNSNYDHWKLMALGNPLVTDDGEILKGARLKFANKRIINSTNTSSNHIGLGSSETTLELENGISTQLLSSRDFNTQGTWTLSFTTDENGLYNKNAGVILEVPQNEFIATDKAYTGQITWLLSAVPSDT